MQLVSSIKEIQPDILWSCLTFTPVELSPVLGASLMFLSYNKAHHPAADRSNKTCLQEHQLNKLSGRLWFFLTGVPNYNPNSYKVSKKWLFRVYFFLFMQSLLWNQNNNLQTIIPLYYERRSGRNVVFLSDYKDTMKFGSRNRDWIYAL